jgi:hypothetical protein
MRLQPTTSLALGHLEACTRSSVAHFLCPHLGLIFLASFADGNHLLQLSKQ